MIKSFPTCIVISVFEVNFSVFKSLTAFRIESLVVSSWDWATVGEGMLGFIAHKNFNNPISTEEEKFRSNTYALMQSTTKFFAVNCI